MTTSDLYLQSEYTEETEESLEGTLSALSRMIVERLASVLDGVLIKLARYDETKLLSSFLSLAVSVILTFLYAASGSRIAPFKFSRYKFPS